MVKWRTLATSLLLVSSLIVPSTSYASSSQLNYEEKNSKPFYGQLLSFFFSDNQLVLKDNYVDNFNTNDISTYTNFTYKDRDKGYEDRERQYDRDHDHDRDGHRDHNRDRDRDCYKERYDDYESKDIWRDWYCFDDWDWFWDWIKWKNP